MILRLPSPSLPSSPLSPSASNPLRRFSSSSFPRPRPRRSILRCAAGNDVVELDAFTKKSGYLFELSVPEANSIADYDISKIGAIYRRKPLILLRRLSQIAFTFGKWFGVRYIDNLTERSDRMFEVRAAELRNILVELGPAYIKIAQAISSRPDLIPPSYLDELSLLQDRISPFFTEVAINTIEQELGLPIEELFSEISPEPVAAASLGQVYQARLRRTGQLVAVKVQRPGVQAAISLDILILRFLAGLLRRIRKLNTDLQAVVDEWASSLFREMDYRTEANNGIRFRQLYGGIPDVLVPEMYLDYTTRRVLVMEWVEGQKLSEVNDLYLVEVGTYCSFNQLLECGFYHADPHPGNLLRTFDGKLAYLDFGMMGEFNQELRIGFIEASLHLVNRDFGALAKDFVTLGFIPPNADKEAVTKALTGFFLCLEPMDSVWFVGIKSLSVFQNAVDKGVQNISFGDLLGDLGATMYKFKFRIPSYFSLVIRSLAVLEGVAIGFNPDYKVLGSTYPWIARKVLTDSSIELKSSLQALLYEDGVFNIDRLESLLSEALRARTEKVVSRKQEDDANSRVVVKQVLSFILAEKGAFVRDLLLQEFVKGLDALGLATLDSVRTSIPFAATFSISTMTNEDKINLRTLRRLLRLLSGLQRNENSKPVIRDDTPYKNQQTNSDEAALVFNQLASVQEILPLLSVLPELPPELQQQLLNLPADLTGRLISRAAARTIRRMIGIAIVGGGICGLATALALHRKGFTSVVLERSESLRATGGGITIRANGWRALDELGVASKLRQTALPLQGARDIYLHNGKQQKISYGGGEARCLKRSDLITTLAESLPVGTIRLGCQAISVKLDSLTSYPTLQLHNGSTIKAKAHLHYNSIASSLLSMVRGFTVYAGGHNFGNEFVQVKGDKNTIGRLPVHDNLVYWFVSHQVHGGQDPSKVSKDPELIRQFTLQSILEEFPSEMVDMIRKSELESVSHVRLRYRPPWEILVQNFRKGSVAVAGDAMHVMGPFIGQGGSAGIEDAIVIARSLAPALAKNYYKKWSGRNGMMVEVGEAFDKYVKERRMRLVMLSTQTYLVGLLQQDSGSMLKFVCLILMATLFSDVIRHTRYDCGRL
ncbi:hypothetical protein C1H46_007892 [Malus baccata]|uniref:Protein kinase domain-containing protein n=1 Tax=Malus baccata TaxID=106549 RepID=A0A540N647_MALBA|nr:hypothetical protein C1H46_007892 [Malus baccata]